MIEIVNIFTYLLIFLLLGSFPIRLCSLKKIHNSKNNLFDLLSTNLIINLCLIFLISFTNINHKFYFILLIVFSLLFNFYYLTKNKNYFHSLINKKFLFFIIINLIIFIYLSKNPTLAWDGLQNWYFKAQNFFYDYNFFDLKNVNNGLNYYPHFGSFLWGFFWKNSFLQYEYFGRLIYVFIFVLSIFSLCDLLNKTNFIKNILISIILVLSFDNFLLKGYQEIILFSFLILISKNIYLYILNQKLHNLSICFVYLNLLPWIKNEGYLFVIIFTISLFIIINKFLKKIEIYYFIFFSCLLIIFKNYIFYRYLNLNLSHGGDLKIIFEFEVIKEFLLAIFFGLFIAIFKYKIWILIIASFILFLKIKKPTLLQLNFFVFLKINLVLYFLMIIGTYYGVTQGGTQNLDWWIDNSLDRILYSISGFFVIQVILVINNFKIYNLK